MRADKSGRRHWRGEAHLRRGVKQLLRELDIGAPLDVRLLCRRLSEHRKRAINLVAYPLPTPGAFGLWIGTHTEDYVLYQRDTTPAHQEHIILHELGHIISEHGGDEDDDDLWAQIFPDIPTDIVLRALRREGYSAVAEREAEMVATVIKEWAVLLEGLGAGGRSTTGAGRLVSGAFDDHQGWL
ncbi:hypothetical protein [Saccharothrix sp. NRRL B-16314]|uniref:hypothetical protein n=1 Tax=Saccharothrix sp. NRRL B-16314 TaxID=1463825 RepID=UPI0009DEC915|nr:hypothetical protein [Saccharothrix sp. NRRL B-16314]